MGFGADYAIVLTPVTADDDEYARRERASPPRPRHGPGQTTSAGESYQPVARLQRPQRPVVRASADVEGGLQPPAGGARGFKIRASVAHVHRLSTSPRHGADAETRLGHQDPRRGLLESLLRNPVGRELWPRR